jgi:hypothetical protein
MCKTHSQLNHSYTIARFGNPMQWNMEVGERGLREWEKRLVRMALKHGQDKFTKSTSDCIKERLLFNIAADQARWMAPVPPEMEVKSRHKMPHFRFEQNKQPNLWLLGQNGEDCTSDEKTGTIQPKILKALNIVERQSLQAYFEIWCEAKLANGQYIRCWHRYQGTNHTQYYDWSNVCFDNTDDNEATEYPAKVLALYEDSINRNLKALVHAAAYKMERNIEGLYSDSRLITHYRLEFDRRGNPKLYSVPLDAIMCCIKAYEAVTYPFPLVPKVTSTAKQREHMVMTILP